MFVVEFGVSDSKEWSTEEYEYISDASARYDDIREAITCGTINANTVLYGNALFDEIYAIFSK